MKVQLDTRVRARVKTGKPTAGKGPVRPSNICHRNRYKYGPVRAEYVLFKPTPDSQICMASPVYRYSSVQRFGGMVRILEGLC